MNEKGLNRVAEESFLQYGGHHPVTGERMEGSNLNADARRSLYKYAVDGRNIWRELILVGMPEIFSRPCSIYDIATGNGELLRMIESSAPETLELIGTEIDEGQIESAELVNEAVGKKPSKIEFIEGNVFRLPFVPQSADIVTMNYLTHHVSKPRLAIRNAAEVARSKIIISGREEGNLAKVSEHAELAANALGLEGPDPVYQHHDLKAIEGDMKSLKDTRGRPVLRVERVRPENLQYCDLEIPVNPLFLQDSNLWNNVEGWHDWSPAVASMYAYIVRKSPIPLSGRDFQAAIDLHVQKAFMEEARARLAEEGRAYVRDEIKQGFVIGHRIHYPDTIGDRVASLVSSKSLRITRSRH